VFTVTNDLVYDQRMIRICSSLASAGYAVMLVGAGNRSSPPLLPGPFTQRRLNTWFRKGPAFYGEYNCRLFFFLLFSKADLFCCIDLDTILPVWMAGILKRRLRVYDAHEYFPQQKEIITRKFIYRIWHWIEQKFVPRFPNGYTVGNEIAAAFRRLYQVNYLVIRNMPLLKSSAGPPAGADRFILYQGALNEARGLEYLVPAMKQVNAKLFLYGDGNFKEQTKLCIAINNLGDKVFVEGKLLPSELERITSRAYIGANLVENIGLNQYYSLANKFFEYIHHLVPQVTMDYPEYRTINEQFEVALLLKDLQPVTISNALNRLLSDEALYRRLRENCLLARQWLNWQQEEKKLLDFYKRVFSIHDDRKALTYRHS
jgi:glycosyltransferase involved in cell wall biosynthesis